MQSHSNSNSNHFDYTERDLPLKTIGIWVAILASGVVAAMAFVYFVYGVPKMQPDPEGVLTRPMNQPTLQSNGYADMKAFRTQQLEALNSYGWVDRSKGIVRLPIQKAIDKTLERGYPARGAQ